MLATEAGDGTVEFLRGYYEAIDGGRIEEAMGHFAAEATVQAGNEPTMPWMLGMQAMAQQLGGVAGTRHEIRRVVEGDEGEAAYELGITYLLENGEEVTLAGAVFSVIREGRFQHQSLYVDLTPVREAVGKGA